MFWKSGTLKSGYFSYFVNISIPVLHISGSPIVVSFLHGKSSPFHSLYY